MAVQADVERDGIDSERRELHFSEFSTYLPFPYAVFCVDASRWLLRLVAEGLLLEALKRVRLLFLQHRVFGREKRYLSFEPGGCASIPLVGVEEEDLQ